MAKYQCKTQSAIPTDEGATTATAKSAGGRLGNSATRQQNKAIGDYLQQKGWTVTGGGGQVKEEYLPPLSGKGRAGSNYIDITATKTTSHGEVTIRINTVDIIAAEKQNIQAQAECSANEDSVVSAAPAEDEMVAEVLANASFARMYNKENAWKYAYTYATSTTTSTANSYYNTDIFNDYSGPDAGDCMNFASQAIYAGFSGSNNLTSVNAGTAPQDTVGIAAGQPNAAQTKWYAKPASTYWAWTSCGYFRDYIDYSVNDTETRLRAVKKPITASSDFSEVGTANLIGSIIHVNGSKPLGHAVIVNNATGTARNQIYFTAHSPNAKNLNLAEEYSGQMVSIRPTYFYDVTTCTGANTSHTFSSTNSKCARCGYVRTYIIPTLLTPMAKNTQITLTARTNHTVSSISMSVKNPNGATTNLGTVTNTTSISKVYTPTVAAHPNDLYTVTVTAVSADGVTTSSTWTFRTY